MPLEPSSPLTCDIVVSSFGMILNPLTLGTLGFTFHEEFPLNAYRTQDHSGYVYKGVSYRSAQRALQKTRLSRRTSCSTHTGFPQ